MINFGKIENGSLIYAPTTRFEKINGRVTSVVNSEEYLLSQGYKKITVIEDVLSEYQKHVETLEETEEGITLHQVATDFTQEELNVYNLEKRNYINSLMMTKAEFLLLVTNLSKQLVLAGMLPSPITLSSIEAFLETDEDTKIRFLYANHVERNHPMLDTVSASFGINADLLDIMFLNKDELITQINEGTLTLEGFA